MRRSLFLLYSARSRSLCSSCDHLRKDEDPDGVGGEVLDARRLAGRDEWDLDRLAEDEKGRDGGRSELGPKDRLRTESR